MLRTFTNSAKVPPECYQGDNDDIQYEEELLRNPFSVKHWQRYIEHKKDDSNILLHYTPDIHLDIPFFCYQIQERAVSNSFSVKDKRPVAYLYIIKLL